MDGIGPVIAESLRSFFAEPHNAAVIERLKAAGVKHELEGPAIAKEGLPWNGLKFVLTGELASMTRIEAGLKIKALGGQTSESVSKKTSVVVGGENPGSKYLKAQTLGVPVLDEAAFLEKLNSVKEA